MLLDIGTDGPVSADVIIWLKENEIFMIKHAQCAQAHSLKEYFSTSTSCHPFLSRAVKLYINGNVAQGLINKSRKVTASTPTY